MLKNFQFSFNLTIFWFLVLIFLKVAMLRPGFEPGICDSKGRNAWPDCAAFDASTPPELQFVYFGDIIKSFLIFYYYSSFQNVFLSEKA